MKHTTLPSGPFVDRIEGDKAVLVISGREQVVAVGSLPANAREGCVLTADLKRVDDPATRAAQARIAEARSAAGKDDDGGDFSL